MPAVSPESGTDEPIRKFARLARAVAAKVGDPEGWPLRDDAEEQVFERLNRQLATRPADEDQAAFLYRHSVREIVALLTAPSHATASGHVDRTTWDQLAVDALVPADRERSLDHARACADCARVWHGVSTFKEEAETRQWITAPGARPWWMAPMVLLGVAVLLLLAVAAFFVTLQTDS